MISPVFSSAENMISKCLGGPNFGTFAQNGASCNIEHTNRN